MWPFRRRSRKRVYLIDCPHSEVDAVKDYPSFFRALPLLVSKEAQVSFGQGAWDRETEAFFSKHAVPVPEVVQRLAEDVIVCLPAEEMILNELAEIAEDYAEPETAGQIVVSLGDRILLEWWDAPFDQFHISATIPEAQVAAFCRKLGAAYRRIGLSADLRMLDAQRRHRVDALQLYLTENKARELCHDLAELLENPEVSEHCHVLSTDCASDLSFSIVSARKLEGGGYMPDEYKLFK
jgi:hypothetical protein